MRRGTSDFCDRAKGDAVVDEMRRTYSRSMDVAMAVSLMVLVIGAVTVDGSRRLSNPLSHDELRHPDTFFGGYSGSGGLLPTTFGPPFGVGSTPFCSFPGISCATFQPTLPGVGAAVGTPP